MVKINTNIILIGPQGSGKSTQAKLLVDTLNYQWLSTGNIIRDYISKNNEMSYKINKIVNSGKLIPDNILFDIILEPVFKKVNYKSLLLFDGIPRNLSQQNRFKLILNKYNLDLPYLFYIKIPDKLVFDRISNRLICPICRTNYMPKNKEYKTKLCSKCNTKLEKRSDDKISSLKKRLEIFHKQTKKIIDIYKKNNKYVEIDGTKSIKEVNKEFLYKLSKLNDN